MPISYSLFDICFCKVLPLTLSARTTARLPSHVRASRGSAARTATAGYTISAASIPALAEAASVSVWMMAICY